MKFDAHFVRKKQKQSACTGHLSVLNLINFHIGGLRSLGDALSDAQHEV